MTSSIRIDRAKFCSIVLKKDLTFKELSELSGVSRQTLSVVKSGKRCSGQTAEKIANALQLNIQEIMEGAK